MRTKSLATTLLAVAVAVTPVVAAPGALAAKKKKPKKAAYVTVRHQPSGFTAKVPRGYRLTVKDGTYLLRKGKQSIVFSRSTTGASATVYGDSLLAALGGTVVSRQATDARFTAQVDTGATRDSVVIQRSGPDLAVTAGHGPRKGALPVATLSKVGGSAKGGYALQAPTPPPAPPQAIALGDYRAPDGGATAQVPTDPGWTISSQGGTLEGSSATGSFLLGFSTNGMPPQNAPAGYTNPWIGPYTDPFTAMATAFPRVTPALANYQLTQVIQENILPTYSQSGLYQFTYTVNGQPWIGTAIIATDDPAKYGGFVWGFYYSGIAVPVGADPAVGLGLVRVWNSWNPSGAIAQRAQQAKELIAETNAVWQQTQEYRGRIQDQQARDVGCLLQGYSVIEDNARKFELPPAPCGQVYVQRR